MKRCPASRIFQFFVMLKTIKQLKLRLPYSLCIEHACLTVYSWPSSGSYWQTWECSELWLRTSINNALGHVGWSRSCMLWNFIQHVQATFVLSIGKNLNYVNQSINLTTISFMFFVMFTVSINFFLQVISCPPWSAWSGLFTILTYSMINRQRTTDVKFHKSSYICLFTMPALIRRWKHYLHVHVPWEKFKIKNQQHEQWKTFSGWKYENPEILDFVLTWL